MVWAGEISQSGAILLTEIARLLRSMNDGMAFE
jgi:hypothetical protein